MYVVFTGDPNKDNQWLFTNVDIETMRVYNDSPSYHFAVVTIKNRDFVNEFFKRFPLFKTTGSIVRVVDFLSSLAKATSDLKACEVTGAFDLLTVTYPEKNKMCEDLVEKQSKEIGNVIQDIEVEMYYTVWKSGLVKSENPYTKVLDDPQIFQDEKTLMVVQDRSVGTEKAPIQYALIIVQPGFLIPTVVAFGKAIKNQSKTVTLTAGYDLNTVIVSVTYDTPLLTATITQPSQRWFVKKR